MKLFMLSLLALLCSLSALAKPACEVLVSRIAISTTTGVLEVEDFYSSLILIPEGPASAEPLLVDLISETNPTHKIEAVRVWVGRINHAAELLDIRARIPIQEHKVDVRLTADIGTKYAITESLLTVKDGTSSINYHCNLICAQTK